MPSNSRCRRRPASTLLQDLTAATVAASSKGCVWNQDVAALLAAAGLQLVSEQRHLGGTLSTLVAVKPQ